eukprot:6492799-Amphidinium_carterae.2
MGDFCKLPSGSISLWLAHVRHDREKTMANERCCSTIAGLLTVCGPWKQFHERPVPPKLPNAGQCKQSHARP